MANGGPAASKEDDANSNQPDSFAGDLVFDIQTLTSVQTDFRYTYTNYYGHSSFVPFNHSIMVFSVGDPCQRAVAFSPDSRLLVTGGTDGVLRVWNFPEMIERNAINASKKEISDVDISPDRKLVSWKIIYEFFL